MSVHANRRHTATRAGQRHCPQDVYRLLWRVRRDWAALAGCDAHHGKTRYAGQPGVYNVVIEYCAEQATRYLLAAAVALVEATIADEPFPL